MRVFSSNQRRLVGFRTPHTPRRFEHGDDGFAAQAMAERIGSRALFARSAARSGAPYSDRTCESLCPWREVTSDLAAGVSFPTQLAIVSQVGACGRVLVQLP
jgi:hypothetical protein